MEKEKREMGYDYDGYDDYDNYDEHTQRKRVQGVRVGAMIAASTPNYRENVAKLVGDVKATRDVFAKQEKKSMALFKFALNGTEVYGKRLAIDGMTWVMKTVGGEIHVIGAKDAVEVVPYTVGVRFYNGGATYHYFAKEGEVAVGDLLWIKDASGLAEVMNIATKSKAANKSLNGWKLAGTPLTEVSVDRD
jgi:hypothetical protein